MRWYTRPSSLLYLLWEMHLLTFILICPKWRCWHFCSFLGARIARYQSLSSELPPQCLLVGWRLRSCPGLREKISYQNKSTGKQNLSFVLGVSFRGWFGSWDLLFWATHCRSVNTLLVLRLHRQYTDVFHRKAEMLTLIQQLSHLIPNPHFFFFCLSALIWCIDSALCIAYLLSLKSERRQEAVCIHTCMRARGPICNGGVCCKLIFRFPLSMSLVLHCLLPPCCEPPCPYQSIPPTGLLLFMTAVIARLPCPFHYSIYNGWVIFSGR